MAEISPFNERERKLIALVTTLNTNEVKVDWQIVADEMGLKNSKVARDSWTALKRSHFADKTYKDKSGAPTPEKIPTEKGAAKKRKANKDVDAGNDAEDAKSAAGSGSENKPTPKKTKRRGKRDDDKLDTSPVKGESEGV